MKPTKKYICSFCARPFSRSEHKLRHERSHTNTKPFSCTHCNTSFVRRDLLQRHLRNVHKIENNDAKNVKITSPPAASANANANNAASVAVEKQAPMNSTKDNQSCPAANVISPPESPASANIVHFNDSNDFTQLLTISKSYEHVELGLQSHIPTLFFIYGTSDIPIEIEESTVYAALCYGASQTNMDDCVKLFNNALSSSVKSLTILATVYLNHYDDLKTQLIPIDVIFNQLDSLLCTMRKQEVGFDHWYIYNIQAQYCLKFNKQPPSSHFNHFLNEVIDSKTLREWLPFLSKSCNYLPSSQNLKVLLNCLIMELQNLKFNFDNTTLSKVELHNCIIMFNRLYISKLIQFGQVNDSNSQFNKIFQISKRHLLLNVPQSFQDLIIDYVLIPFDENHLNLLKLTLREFEYWNSVQPLNTSTMGYKKWFNELQISTINNNLGLIAYPLLVLGSLPLKMSQLDSDFKDIVLEVFLIMIKVFQRNDSSWTENVILKGAAYLLFESSNESFNERYDCNVMIDKLFTVLKKWLDYYQIDIIDIDLFQREVCVSPLSTPPNSMSPRSSSIVSIDSLRNEHQNYSYGNAINSNANAKIMLPPLSVLPNYKEQQYDQRLRLPSVTLIDSYKF